MKLHAWVDAGEVSDSTFRPAAPNEDIIVHEEHGNLPHAIQHWSVTPASLSSFLVCVQGLGAACVLCAAASQWTLPWA